MFAAAIPQMTTTTILLTVTIITILLIIQSIPEAPGLDRTLSASLT
jgi:hypothetical protein